MPVITLDTWSCSYRHEGAADRPALLLSHSLGLDLAMWEPQAVDLARHFQVVRFDTRGHGASGVTPGDYTIDRLGRDALALADALGLERFAFCGLSLGGMIGMWLARHAPDRLTHLVLANTSARPDATTMESRRTAVLERGMSAIETVVMGRFFSATSLEANPPAVSWARRTLLATHPTGYAGCCAAIRDHDARTALPGIRVPTLVISGNSDVSLPWAGHSEILASEIPGARVVHLPTAHISNLERPRSFSAALFEFLAPEPADPLEAGAAVRRAVLGDAHVDRATRASTDFTREFQAFLTRTVWGTIWTRPGLDRRTRRLLVLTTTAALGRWEEFRLHVRAALLGEVEACDLKETLLQVAAYAGVPAANAAFHIAQEELSRLMAPAAPPEGERPARRDS